ncbi:MAG: aldo/keto reductase [Betaproteobacteria bacterium]|nr:aldo/keto reductase [Betaproteobacteria bacterium]
MESRNIGSSGLRVSLVGLGCNNFGARVDLPGTRRVVDRALDAGITFFDTADSYGNRGGSETCLGEALGERRQRIVLATKFASPMDDTQTLKCASRRYIMSAVEASLRRLKTDWIDLYQLHWPDPLTPMEETLRALDDLVRQGKVRYIGCSNLAPWQVADAMWTARHHGLHGFISTQDEYSLLVRDVEKTMFPVLGAYGLGLLPYFPLAGGLLTGKYKRGAPLPAGRLRSAKASAERFLTERNWAIVEQLDAFCAARNRTLAELAFSWLASHREVSSVIAGATTPEQIDINVAAAGWHLTPDELAEIDRIADAP